MGLRKSIRINLAYLLIYICLTLIQFRHPPHVPQYPHEIIWAIASFLYPLCFPVKVRVRFLKGLLTLCSFPIIAYAVECLWYLVRTGEFRFYDTDTVVIFGFYLLGPLANAVIWYPIGFLMSRRIMGSNGATHHEDR